MYENEVEYTCSIKIDGTSLHEYIEAVNINMQEDNYVNEVSIDFNKDSWSLYNTICDPATNRGTERIVITLNGVDYKFLLEKRSSSMTNEGKVFSVWGRSKAALLDLPYAVPITDSEDSTNYWQSPIYARTASEIVNHLLAGTGISVQFLIDDFTVYSTNFSVANETPIQIINRLVGVPGGRVRSDVDGNLIIDYKEYGTDFNADLPAIEFTDIDEIVQLDEEIIEPPGYNRVRVVGYEEGIDTADKTITIELVDDACVAKGQEFDVKVYTEPLTLDFTFDTTIGEFSHIGEYTETHTETIFFTDGKGSSRYPIYSVTSAAWHGDDLGNITWQQGFKSLIADTEAFGVLEITYVAQYNQYSILIFETGGAILFAEEDVV
jgi:hypothetical protein